MWKKRCEIEIVCQSCLFCMERKLLTNNKGERILFLETLDYKSFQSHPSKLIKINNEAALKS